MQRARCACTGWHALIALESLPISQFLWIASLRRLLRNFQQRGPGPTREEICDQIISALQTLYVRFFRKKFFPIEKIAARAGQLHHGAGRRAQGSRALPRLEDDASAQGLARGQLPYRHDRQHLRIAQVLVARTQRSRLRAWGC
eukprot:3969927-Pleurochrysis_carterae.AAC.1